MTDSSTSTLVQECRAGLITIFYVKSFLEDFVGEGEGVEDGLPTMLVQGYSMMLSLSKTSTDFRVRYRLQFSAPVVKGEF